MIFLCGHIAYVFTSKIIVLRSRHSARSRGYLGDLGLDNWLYGLSKGRHDFAVAHVSEPSTIDMLSGCLSVVECLFIQYSVKWLFRMVQLHRLAFAVNEAGEATLNERVIVPREPEVPLRTSRNYSNMVGKYVHSFGDWVGLGVLPPGHHSPPAPCGASKCPKCKQIVDFDLRWYLWRSWPPERDVLPRFFSCHSLKMRGTGFKTITIKWWRCYLAIRPL